MHGRACVQFSNDFLNVHLKRNYFIFFNEVEEQRVLDIHGTNKRHNEEKNVP